MDSIKNAPLRIYQIRSKYKVIDKVGRGTYGTVFKVLSLQDNQFYAIKKFQNTEAKLQVEGFPITALREISLLKQLNHPNIINLKQIICSRPNKRNLFRGSTFLVFEYMHHDFSGLFKSKIKFSQSQIKCMMKQILEGCYFLHQNKVMHRDIKSANILLNDNGIVQLADFGLGRRTRFENVFTYKVVTLWYRAPELLLGNKSYNHKIDVWSIGCVFAEFLIGDVLFKRQTQYAIIEKIYEICGGLEQNEFTQDYLRVCAYYHDMKPKKPYENNLIKYIKKQNPDVDSLSLQFLKGLLELNPYKRLSCQEALAHEYFSTAPLPCQPEEIQQLDVEYHEMFRDRSLKIEREKKKQSVNWTDEEEERKKRKIDEHESKDKDIYKKNFNYLTENNREPFRLQLKFERKSYDNDIRYEIQNRKDYRGENDRKNYHKQADRKDYIHRQGQKQDYRDTYSRKQDDKQKRKHSYSHSKSKSKSYSSSSSSSSSQEYSKNKIKRTYEPIEYEDRKSRNSQFYNQRQREYTDEREKKYDRDGRQGRNYERQPHSIISKYHHTNSMNRWNDKSQRYESERKNERENSRNYRESYQSRDYRQKFQNSKNDNGDRYPRHSREQQEYLREKPYRQKQESRKPYYQGRQQRLKNFDQNKVIYKSQKYENNDSKYRRDAHFSTDYGQNRNSTDYSQSRSHYKGRQYCGSESFKNQHSSYTKNYDQRGYNNNRSRQGNYYEQQHKKDYLMGREDYKKISIQKRQIPSKKPLDFQQY